MGRGYGAPARLGELMSGYLGGEGLALMEVEHSEQTNGHGTPPPLVFPANGFRIKPRERQVFLDGEFAGVVATMRANAPIGEFLALTELGAGISESDMSRAFAEVINRLPRLIISWNLQDEAGEPVPVTPEAIRAHVPLDLLMALLGKMGGGEPVPKG